MITYKSDLLALQSMNHLGVPENKMRDVNMVIRTSGSSGNPLSVAMNDVDIKNITDVGALCFNNAGVRQGMRVIHCLNFQMWAGGALDFMSLVKSGAAAFPYGVGNAKELINTIMYYDIEGISCTPSYMRRLKEVLKTEFNMDPKTLGLKYGFFGGESGLQNPKFRKNIEDEWGIEALNANYGSADSISMFASENYYSRDGLQFQARDIAEAHIKVGDQILPPRKGLVGELLITTTYNGGLINRTNYNIGDIIEVTSNGPDFTFNVLGRADEMVVIRGLNVYPSAIRDIVSEVGMMYEYPDIQFQLRVSEEDPIERAELLIDIREDEYAVYDPDLCEHIQKDMRDKLSLNIPIIPGKIEMSSNGKIKTVRRML